MFRFQITRDKRAAVEVNQYRKGRGVLSVFRFVNADRDFSVTVVRGCDNGIPDRHVVLLRGRPAQGPGEGDRPPEVAAGLQWVIEGHEGLPPLGIP
ncbi:hypothetical protein [Streptomyces sp. JJ38]|uniref:hypothetical protein n=1 Tax=Streptomyces sp. JJ38 TaxID=2738128 RepID=UPI0027DEB0BB|nr:hypothetical protein [Streptomyces sp. JJ38]